MSGVRDPIILGAGAAPTAGYQADVIGNLRVSGNLDVVGTISGLSIATVPDTVVVDIDFTTLANNTFADGAEVIAGFTFTAANTAATNTWEVLNGTGLRFNAAASSTAFTNAAQTAANLQIGLLSLIPTFDPLRTYVIDFYLSSVTFGTSPNRFFAGFFLNTGGTDRLIGGGRRNSAGTQQTYSIVDATINGDTATDNAFGVRMDCRGVATFSGTYAAGFPTYIHGGGTFAVPDGFNGPFDPTQSTFVMAWPTGEAGGAMDCTLARLRIRRIAA